MLPTQTIEATPSLQSILEAQLAGSVTEDTLSTHIYIQGSCKNAYRKWRNSGCILLLYIASQST
jgi:hypothetical protein